MSKQTTQIRVTQNQKKMMLPYQVTEFVPNKLKPKSISSNPFYAYTFYKKQFNQPILQEFEEDKSIYAKSSFSFYSRTGRSSRMKPRINSLSVSTPQKQYKSIDFPKTYRNQTLKSKNIKDFQSPNFPFNLNFLLKEMKKKNQIFKNEFQQGRQIKANQQQKKIKKNYFIYCNDKWKQDLEQIEENKKTEDQYHLKQMSNYQKLKLYNQALVQKQLLQLKENNCNDEQYYISYLNDNL